MRSNSFVIIGCSGQASQRDVQDVWDGRAAICRNDGLYERGRSIKLIWTEEIGLGVWNQYCNPAVKQREVRQTPRSEMRGPTGAAPLHQVVRIFRDG